MDPNFPDVVLRPGGGRRCRVVYSYTPQNDDELDLQEKDEIEFISEVEEGWWRGRLGGKVGVFPSNFVVELSSAAPEETPQEEGDWHAPPSSADEEVPVLPPKPVREQCRVLFSYDAAIEDELTLMKDDIVTIIAKDVEDKGWWKGELRGKIGLFPDNFVQIISPVDENVAKEQKKPDRPVKNAIVDVKGDSKIPLISSLGTKKSELENSCPMHNETATKRKSTDLNMIKPDTVASHRKSLEEKAANEAPPVTGKKPPQRPPVSGKPKPPATAKPTSVKRLSAELDLVDGALPSKLNSRLKSIDSTESVEELDLDSVGRSDMLSHITTSRPRAPGRRPPSSTSNNKDTDGSSPVMNGTIDGVKAEKVGKEKQKQHLPFMDELKVNLKSSKPVVETNSSQEKKAVFGLWGSKVNSHTNAEISTTTSPTTNSSSHETSHVKSLTDLRQSTEVRQSSNAISSSATTSYRNFEKSEKESVRESVSSKVSELSSVFDERLKVIPNVNDVINHDSGPKKDVSELKRRVEKLERTVAELMNQLKEESDKRRQIEKELIKLTDLVTQV